jgi:hypothetical protein
MKIILSFHLQQQALYILYALYRANLTLYLYS